MSTGNNVGKVYTTNLNRIKNRGFPKHSLETTHTTDNVIYLERQPSLDPEGLHIHVASYLNLSNSRVAMLCFLKECQKREKTNEYIFYQLLKLLLLCWNNFLQSLVQGLGRGDERNIRGI